MGESIDQDWCNALGTLVKDEDPYERICSTHAPPNSDTASLHGEEWLDYNNAQTRHYREPYDMVVDLSPTVRALYEKIPPKPCLVLEPAYQLLSDTVSSRTIRSSAWTAVLSGAAGHSYGAGDVWEANNDPGDSSYDWPSEGDLAKTLAYEGSAQVGSMAEFMRGIEWWKLEPNPSLVSGARQAFCAADTGKAYVVYLAHGGSVNVDLSSAAGKPLAAC